MGLTCEAIALEPGWIIAWLVVNPPAATVRNERWLSRARRLGRGPLPRWRAGATDGGGSRLKRGGFTADGVPRRLVESSQWL